MKMATIHNPLLLLLTLCIFGCVKGCAERERLALLDFKKSFASFPQNYGKLSSWNSSEDAKDCCSSWEGVGCDGPDGHVVDLDLSNQGLKSYQLRPSILELQHLISLNLRENNLAMRIPEFISSFSKLSILDLSHSKFFGSVPTVFWRSLPSCMGYFNLSFNNLHGVVPNLPFQFYGLYPFTVTIDLTSNAFHGPIPPLFFSANELYLSMNKFSSFAPSPYSNNISDLYSASIVDISDNRLSGEIPQWLWSQSWMNSLNLANNNLTGILPSSTNTSNMYALNLSNNSFFGPLPSLLKNCTNIRIVDLGGNRFSGLIPSWLGESLNSLAVLSLKSNNFIATLPSNMFNLRSLKILDLSRNKLSGNIPSCVDNLAAMVHQVNSSILLPGARNAMIPVPVDEVDFYHAFVKWKGTARLFQKNLELVRLIDLSNNNLSGEIPTELTSLLELKSLDLSSNNFHGSIPNKIGQLRSLEYLNMSYNKLSGPIPPSLSDISSLSMLDISYNNLSGRIPEGTQLQGFNSSAFAGNLELCGLPLQVKCPGDVDDSAKALQPSATYESDKEDKWEDKLSFYAGLGAGFACSFFGILGSLIWIRKWRYAFFQTATRFGEWTLLVVALSTSKITRKLWLK